MREKSEVLVRYEDRIYRITNNGTIQRLSNADKENFDVMILRKVNPNILEIALERGFKVFECEEVEQECLKRVLNILFPKCKDCKFI